MLFLTSFKGPRSATRPCRTTVGQNIQSLWEQTDFDFTVEQCLVSDENSSMLDGEQRKMEETGSEVTCGAATTLAVFPVVSARKQYFFFFLLFVQYDKTSVCRAKHSLHQRHNTVEETGSPLVTGHIGSRHCLPSVHCF